MSDQITTGPYDSIRDYIEAMVATGNMLRIPEMDQDAYETTAFAYRSCAAVHRISGRVPRRQAGHMTAPDRGANRQIALASNGPSTHDA